MLVWIVVEQFGHLNRFPFKLHSLVCTHVLMTMPSINLLVIVLGIFNFGDIQGREGWERLYQNSYWVYSACMIEDRIINVPSLIILCTLYV